MYAHFDGVVAEKLSDSIVLDVNGVGYLLLVSAQTLSMAPSAGGRMKLYATLSVREDAMELFGFYSREEKRMFERLRSVSGVGPRMALSILSSSTPETLAMSIITGDEKALTVAPGIGKKIAQRIILELKDKLAKGQMTAGGEPYGGTGVTIIPENKSTEAAAALAVLGYSTQEVSVALKGIDVENLKLEDVIRQALKKMVK